MTTVPHNEQTPISVLQDLCSRHLSGKVPEYQLLSSECMVQKPHTQNGTKFVYRVEIGSVVATAPGQSKKKAKHAAALAALQSLLLQVDDPVASRYMRSVLAAGDTADEKPDSMLTDAEMNSVGKLQELCMKKRWRPPSYDTFEEIGAPHERMFRMVCEVNCDGTLIRSEGTGRSKKLAKRSAAIRMMSELESQHHLPSAQTAALPVTTQTTAARRPDLIPENGDLLNRDLCTVKQADAYDKLVAFMKGIGRDLNQELDPLFASDDSHESLSLISDFLECRADYHSLPASTGLHNAFVHLTPIDKFQTPITISSGWGVGATEEQARTAAARRLLLNLNTIRYIE